MCALPGRHGDCRFTPVVNNLAKRRRFLLCAIVAGIFCAILISKNWSIAAETADQTVADEGIAADSAAADSSSAQAGGCGTAFLGSYVKGPQDDAANAEAEASGAEGKQTSQASINPQGAQTPPPSANAQPGSYEATLQCYEPNPDNTVVCIMDSKEVTCTITADSQTICPSN